MTIPFRRPRSGVRPSPVFLAVLAIAAVGGAFAWSATVDTRSTRFAIFMFVVGGWVVTLCLHEFAHAFLAWRFGDHEVEARGYLTLNPLKYSHPVLSILLPVVFIAMGGIGLPGGAVYVHPNRFRTDLQRALVSLSGPAVNAVSAVVLLILARVYGPNSAHGFFWIAVAFLGLLQITATILNLLPVPGLDGYGTIEPYLDPNFRQGAEQFKPFGMLAVFALLQVASIHDVFFRSVYWLFETSGLSRATASYGFTLVQFWRG